MIQSTEQRSRRPRRGLLVLIGALSLVSLGAMSADADVDLDATRATIEQWVETRRIISEEKRDWALAREMLTERIELVQNEIDALRDKIREARSEANDLAQQSAELNAERDALKATSERFLEVVTALEARTRELLTWLPAVLLEKVGPISRRFPEDPSDTATPISDRFLYVIGVLNEIDKFNREVTVTNEFRELEDGTSASVTTMYVGLGQAYYIGANGKAAGVGRPTAAGWVWTSHDAAVDQIAHAIAIFDGAKAASFVRLPLELK